MTGISESSYFMASGAERMRMRINNLAAAVAGMRPASPSDPEVVKVPQRTPKPKRHRVQVSQNVAKRLDELATKRKAAGKKRA